VIDYIHRIGRVARAGKEGIVSAFIGTLDREIAQGIMVRGRGISLNIHDWFRIHTSIIRVWKE